MKNLSKNTVIWIISSFGVTTATTTVGVAATNNNYQRLFGSLTNDWTIIKEDLESEGDSFSKVATKGNIIEFSKTNNSVVNLTPLIGLESVTPQSTNSYLQISTGFNEGSFLYKNILRII